MELMANKAMKDRHWDRIAKLTKHTFDFESENFTLRNIMEAPLLEHKEDIEVRIQMLMFCVFAMSLKTLLMLKQRDRGKGIGSILS